MEISDKLLCLFSTEVAAEEDRYTIEVPKGEVEAGDIEPGDVYRVALISRDIEADGETEVGAGTGTGAGAGGERSHAAPSSEPQPPVEVGEIRYVEVEDIGKQGDGIARVERGYVIIVPGADVGERVKIEVSEVKSNFAVGEIIDETF